MHADTQNDSYIAIAVRYVIIFLGISVILSAQ